MPLRLHIAPNCMLKHSTYLQNISSRKCKNAPILNNYIKQQLLADCNICNTNIIDQPHKRHCVFFALLNNDGDDDAEIEEITKL